MQFEHNNKQYEVGNLCIGQVELISELIHDFRDRVFKDRLIKAQATGDITSERSVYELEIAFSDMLHEIERARKASYFVALCVHEAGKPWDETEVSRIATEFKTLPETVMEDVLSNFFTSASFVKRLIRDFLMKAQAVPPMEA